MAKSQKKRKRVAKTPKIANSDLQEAKISSFRPQVNNPNKHTQRGIGMLAKAIGEDGWIGAMTVAADGESFDGSARLEVLGTAMPDAKPIVVETDGHRPVIVVRKDIPTADDPRAKRLGIGANQIASVDLDWDPAVLAIQGVDLKPWFTDAELKGLGVVEPTDSPNIDSDQKLIKCPACGHEFTHE